MQLTAPERAFVEYTTALADWLEPYHDYIRPPATAILADAVKQSETKGGSLLKKSNGSLNANELPNIPVDETKKKEREVPVAKEAPLNLVDFFQGTSS